MQTAINPIQVFAKSGWPESDFDQFEGPKLLTLCTLEENPPNWHVLSLHIEEPSTLFTTMENHTVSRTRETLTKDIGKLKDNALQLKENALLVAQDVKNHATAHVDETRQRFADTVVTTREYLVAHPLSLLGAGFALGLLFGLRLRR